MAYVMQPAPATQEEAAQCECAAPGDISAAVVDRSATLGDVATLASVISLIFYVFQGRR
jgi:hypothetical protein